MVGISMPRSTWNFIALNVSVVGEERLRTVTLGVIVKELGGTGIKMRVGARVTTYRLD
jgi:hypothetical protein